MCKNEKKWGSKVNGLLACESSSRSPEYSCYHLLPSLMKVITILLLCYELMHPDWPSSHKANPEVSDFIHSHSAGGEINQFDKWWIPEGLPPVIQPTEIAHSLHDECCPTHTLHLTWGKMDSLPCYFSSLFFTQHARLSVMLTITTSTHQMGMFAADRLKSFNMHPNWLLASESFIKEQDVSWQAACIYGEQIISGPMGPF